MYHAVGDRPDARGPRAVRDPGGLRRAAGGARPTGGFTPLTTAALAAAWRDGRPLPARAGADHLRRRLRGRAPARPARARQARLRRPPCSSRPAGCAARTTPAAPWTPCSTGTRCANSPRPGVEIGGHSHSHPQLDQLGDARLRHELLRCREIVTEELGTRTGVVRLPLRLLQPAGAAGGARLGFRPGARGGQRASRGRCQGPYALARLTVRRGTGIEEFARLVEGRAIGRDLRPGPCPHQGVRRGPQSTAGRRKVIPVPVSDTTDGHRPRPPTGRPATAKSAGRAAAAPARRPGLAGAPGGGSPLFRNAYALMLNTGISGVLGLGFWLVAARYYTEAAVGQGSAAIAAMKLLAGPDRGDPDRGAGPLHPGRRAAPPGGWSSVRTRAVRLIVARGRGRLPADARPVGALVPLPARAAATASASSLAVVAWSCSPSRTGC